MKRRIAIHDDMLTLRTGAAGRGDGVQRRWRHASLIGLGLLAACESSTSEPGVCFPLPAGAAVMVARSEMETQGTSLQGSLRPGEDHNGPGLQGPAAAAQPRDQGTGLQGRRPGEQEQGSSLQGAGGGEQNQGTGLQGGPPGDKDQGTGLQRSRRAYRGLGDLNGARLALEADATNAVTLRDGQLVARGFADTAALRGTPLTATAPDGRTFRVEIAAITLDGRIRRTELLVDGLPVCDAGQHGVLVAGSWDGRGAHVDSAATVTYSCMEGVIAKCVVWGYAPWLTSAEVHAGCTRMARADYCGDGIPWTMDGTLIDAYDRLGVQAQPAGGTFEFEAAWGPGGALCVARPRYQIEDSAGRALLPDCFATLPTCHSLDEAAALGAVLANQSRLAPIEACE